MPKTDITDQRALQRLQGIDLREHGDQNTSMDCVNLHLNNASRLTNFRPPTRVVTGNYTFACESKDPGATEFSLSLNTHMGAPAITQQLSYESGNQVQLTGSNLVGDTLVILTDSNGHCLVSGLDFELGHSGDSLLLGLLWSDYANYSTITIKNAYGWTTFDVDVTERLNNVLYFGNDTDGYGFKMGIDPQTLELCLWQKVSGSWMKMETWMNYNATPWIESAENRVNVEFLAVADGPSNFIFAPPSPNYDGLGLSYSFFYQTIGECLSNAELIQKWGTSSPYHADGSATLVQTMTSYAFGQYGSYRLYFSAGSDGLSLSIQSKSNYLSNIYDTTLKTWTHE